MKKACDRLGWHRYYAKRYEYHAKQYNTTQSEQAEHLACWYYLLHLAFDGPTPVTP